MDNNIADQGTLHIVGSPEKNRYFTCKMYKILLYPKYHCKIPTKDANRMKNRANPDQNTPLIVQIQCVMSFLCV